jgi:hypothetical protein
VSDILLAPLRLLLWAVRSLATLLFALVLLFEEWGWRPLAELMATIARLRLLARLEAVIMGLPPYAALAVFVLPSGLLFPVKLLALWLLAQGKLVMAGLLLAGAKVVSTALVARIFMLTRPALMQLAWFARLYNWLVPWKEAIFAQVRASWLWRWGRIAKQRARQSARAFWRLLWR